jgi:hydrogenase maturation factor
MGVLYGKIRPKILEEVVYKHLGAKRNDVILGPSIGEDAAIVKVNGIKLVASCDPISGAISRIGWLAVNVAANDIATRGAKPLWYLSCILLPKNSSEVINEICRDMDIAAKRLDIAIIGGHSEVTPGIDHPIIVGFCAGYIKKDKFFLTSGRKSKAKIILTKGAGIEGTGILATDLKDTMLGRFGKDFVLRANRYLDLISVIPEAMLASSVDGVLSMHDPTEGGVAGGLNEMADASKCGFKVYEKDIIIREETARICDFLRIDPLKLISSGSLLIAVKSQAANTLTRKMKNKGIAASIIGEFLEDKSSRTIVRTNEKEEPLEAPESDEIWKIINNTQGS